MILEEHSEAIEADLIRMGLRLRWLGTGRLDWRDLYVLVKHADPHSALRRSIGDGWSVTEHLLALVADELAVANWQRQGKKNAPRPRPVKRPGAETTQKIGSEPIPLSQFADWWESGN